MHGFSKDDELQRIRTDKEYYARFDRKPLREIVYQWRWRLAVLAVLVVLIYGCFASLDRAMGIQRNVWRYQQYLQHLQAADFNLVSHFPETIVDPDRASVAYSSGPLQASMFLELRLELSPTEIATIEREISSKAIATIKRGKPSDDSEYLYNGDDTIGRFAVESKDGESMNILPEHFTLYVLHSRERWETAGIAISKHSNEVIYWAHPGD